MRNNKNSSVIITIREISTMIPATWDTLQGKAETAG
jgi:hypothetical protein